MFLLIVAGVSTLIFLFFVMKYTYWKRRNVPGPTPVPILGNYKELFTCKEMVGVVTQKIYQQFHNEPYVGAYYGTEPVIIPRDPEMIKTIMAKDFQYFSGRSLVEHEDKDPLVSQNLFFTSGDNWKTLRSNLNPLFSSAKLKNMSHLVTKSANKLQVYLDNQYKKSDVQEFKSISVRYILEVLGSCLFGLDFDTLCEGDSFIKNVADKISRVDNLKSLKTNIREIWPSLYHLYSKKNPLVDDEVIKVFFDMAKQSFESRGQKPGERNDLVDLLLKFKEQGFIEGDGVRSANGEAKRMKIEVTDNMLVGQTMVFFGAGFETSSSALAFTLYELAKNSKVQERLLEEIEDVLKKHNGEITYEAIQEMKYLNMVLLETSRMYPALGIITREATSDYKFNDYGLKVKKGMRIHIPVWAIHYDPKYYPDPEKFDPERFSPEEMQKRDAYTYLAFGEGHRICIGLRFSKLQVAAGLISILRKFRLEHCDRTSQRMEFDPRSFGVVPNPKTPIDLKLIPRT